ncbi:hypothetical protein C1H46_025707 [Malus baccata]|uniref:Uncharacterized protein n=1 Tax=Malus baccata TaxID=106549 RepID=A0A540LQI5_MALBA|nr:hypothetical protein C1H46_025707 [Malus baccata]
MGNCHGHHRKCRNGPVSSETASSGFKYGLSGQAIQIPCSSSSSAKKTSNMVVALPYAHVDSILRALATQAEGFGRLAFGGLNGVVCHITTLADDGPGSLREGCRKKEPIWIVFEISGTIYLQSHLNISSYKTIDGRGQRIKLTGKGLRLKECEHVIIFSECNIYEAGKKKVAFKYLTEKAADKETAVTGHIRSEGDLFVTRTQVGLSPDDGEHCMFHPTQHYQTWTKGPPVDDLKHVLQHCTG